MNTSIDALYLDIKGNTLFLSGNCSFASVAAIDNPQGLSFTLQSLPAHALVDLSGVHNSSSAILPLLLQIKRTAAKQQKRIQFTQIPHRLLDMIKLADLDEIILGAPA